MLNIVRSKRGMNGKQRAKAGMFISGVASRAPRALRTFNSHTIIAGQPAFPSQMCHRGDRDIPQGCKFLLGYRITTEYIEYAQTRHGRSLVPKRPLDKQGKAKARKARQKLRKNRAPIVRNLHTEE